MSMATTQPAANPRRILVATKYRFIGDTLLAVPMLQAIRQQWPDATISLVTGGKAHELLEGCPYFDEVIEFDPYRPADEGLRRFFQFVSELRKRKFDLAFICNRSFHSALTTFLGGAKRRVGWGGFQGRDFLLTDVAAFNYDGSEIECYLDIYRHICPGVATSSYLELWPTHDEIERAAGLLPRAVALIGIQPGATHLEKRWPAENYARLMAEIRGKWRDVKFVLLGGPDEEAEAAATLAECDSDLRADVVSLVGKLALRETMAVVSHLQLFVAGDTAIRHVAVALDVPSVALFGPTSVNKWGNAAPPRHLTIQAATSRVADITVDTVAEAAETVYSARRAASHDSMREVAR